MKDWNVVVSVYQDGFRRAIHTLEKMGAVDRSPYFNVLLMRVADPVNLLDTVERMTAESPALYDAVSRVAPAMETFEFHSPEEFLRKSGAILHEWSDRLAGRSFHARLHCRGGHGKMPSPQVEKALNDEVLALTASGGNPARITFTDPDAVIVIDTVDDRAGIAVWTREDLSRHHLLKPD